MKSRSLTKAAEQVHLSQPAISQALRDLEGQFGLTLFVRGGRQMRPTAEALALLPEVERLAAQVGALTARALELRDTRAGQLAIAAIPVLAVGSMPCAIARLLESRPKARANIMVMTTAETVDLVKQERADIGLTFSPVAESGIVIEPLLETNMCCVVNASSPLAKRKTLSIIDLKGHQVAVLSAETPPGLLLRRAVPSDHIETMAQAETNSASCALALVQSGIGVAIVDPLAVLSAPLAGLTVRALEPAIRLDFAIIRSRHRDMSKIAIQFSQLFREELRTQAKTLKRLGLEAKIY